jgi:zinc transport system substrate-binding protein
MYIKDSVMEAGMLKGIMRSTAAGFIYLIVITLLLAACGRTENNNIADTEDNGLNVVTSFYPLYLATINVTKDIPGVTVTNMTEPQTGCLHDYALRPADLKTLEKADVFIINGAGMEAFLDDVVSRQKNLKVVEASEGIPLLKDENGEENAHAWVSVTNAITYVNNIAGQLSVADPVNEAKYRANTAAYVQKLTDLKDEMHSVLDGLKNRDIITFHEAFPYFAQEFDLNIAAVVEREPGSEPAPRELADIIDTIKQTGIRALFAEPQYSPKAAEAIARETGAKVFTLDPVVTGEAVPGAADAYIERMKENVESLIEALGDRN